VITDLAGDTRGLCEHMYRWHTVNLAAQGK